METLIEGNSKQQLLIFMLQCPFFRSPRVLRRQGPHDLRGAARTCASSCPGAPTPCGHSSTRSLAWCGAHDGRHRTRMTKRAHI
eukprot:scaffold119322_cov33-Tisochrysis_lutea.AAC.1